jgi:hypothetical protein
MDAAGHADQLFGEIALRLFFCARRDLDRALKAQVEAREAGSEPTIGEVLRGLGILTKEQVEAVLRAQELYDEKSVETLYGRIAIKNRFITPAALEDAMTVHDRVGGRLRVGEILVKRGHISWEQHDSILRLQERLLRQIERKKAREAGAAPSVAVAAPPPEALHRKMPSSHHGQRSSGREG